MVDSDPGYPLDHFDAQLEGYLAGTVPLTGVVAAFRALPHGASLDLQVRAHAGRLPAGLEARREALWSALRDPERAG